MEKHTSHRLHKRISRNMWQNKRTWVIALAVLVVAGGGIIANKAAHAAANTLYVTPGASTYTVGGTVSIQVREDSGATGVYSVQAGLNYPKSLLQYVSTDGNSSAFGTDTGLGNGGNGHVEIIRGSLQPITNDQLVATVNFTVIANGSATVSFDPTCQGTSTSNCSGVYDATIANIISSTVSGTYTLNVSTCPAGQTGTPPNCTTPPTTCPTGQTGTPPNCTTPTGGGTGNGSSSTTTKSTSTAVTPKGSSTAINAPNGSQVQVSTPADIQPATIQPDGVQKIQYYLNNKLVYTANAMPYTYHLDTRHLLNGTYTLKSIKFYISGKQETSTQKLLIKNPFSFVQFGLLLRHYLVEILIPFILIVAALVLVYFRIHHIKWYKGPGSSTPDVPKSSSPTMNVQGPTVVTPSN